MRIFHLLLALSLLLTTAQAPARERIALVIGNADYSILPLRNPLNDARDMSAVLQKAGFRVMLKTNVDQDAMERAIGEFGRALHSESEALFYYSGHGAQHGGENYLIPINAIPRISVSDHLRHKAVSGDYVLSVMKAAGSPVKIMILDACRNSPFPAFGKSLTAGLAHMRAVKGTLIAYATAPGMEARDDSPGGRNSPYTDKLLQFIQRPGLTLDQVLKNTGRSVQRVTDGKQTPWYSSSIYGDFVFIEKQTARLTIHSSPDHANTWIDGKPYNTTPMTAELSLGNHQVRVAKQGFETYEQALRLEQDINLIAQLKSLPPQTAYLTVHSEPSYAKIRIDGKSYNTTPVTVQLSLGYHHLQVVKDGFKTYEQRVELRQDHKITAHLEAALRTWREPVTGLEFALIRGDCFRMGSPASETERSGNETPHRICVGDFWLATTEVTNAQYRRFRSHHNSGYHQKHPLNGDNQPAVFVSWEDAVAFTEWLNRSHRGKYQFRLPTEAEWEYAARAGTQTARYWGENTVDACRYANMRGCNNNYAASAPSGRFQANGFGLYDMLGNVWEWTCSEWMNLYKGEEKNCSRKKPSSGFRAFRGGAWDSKPRQIRSAVRDFWEPDKPLHYVGFRPARIK